MIFSAYSMGAALIWWTWNFVLDRFHENFVVPHQLILALLFIRKENYLSCLWIVSSISVHKRQNNLPLQATNSTYIIFLVTYSQSCSNPFLTTKPSYIEVCFSYEITMCNLEHFLFLWWSCFLHHTSCASI